MITNIHGYGSDGKNSKYRWLRKNYTDNIFSPTFDYSKDNPLNILNHLYNKIKLSKEDKHVIVASSLGGFFGYILHVIDPSIITILLNPSLIPFGSLMTKYRVDYHITKMYARLFGEYFYDYDSEYGFYDSLHVIYNPNDHIIDHHKTTIAALPHSFRNIYKVKAPHRMPIKGEVERIIKKLIA